MPKYVIVGGSVGTVGAIEAIREVDADGTITVVSEETPITYSRPMIGEFLLIDAPTKKLAYRSEEFWRLNKVETVVGKKTIGVDFAEKCVRLDGGEKVHFEKLLIASGSRPVAVKISGVDRDGVFTFTTLADASAMKKRIKSSRRAVVVGGGLIGVYAADVLSNLGLKTTIVELRERILSLLLDQVASEIVKARIQEKGADIFTGRSVQKILGKEEDDSQVGAVVLDNGKVIACDIVVMAVGVKPRIELVQGTEIKTNTGIIVDRFMRTNIPDVYACGDAAEAYDFILNGNRVLPQWPTAYAGGRVAGYNMAGKETEYSGGTLMSTLKYFGIPVAAAGLTDPKDDLEYEILKLYDPATSTYKKVVIKNDKVVGFILVNNIERAGTLYYLMSKGVKITGFKEKLLSENFGLVSLPATIRNTMLEESRRR
ncbi:MAG: NAD(P)/FAD-dependent oxidoreductase [Nitrososphaeria archaeon]